MDIEKVINNEVNNYIGSDDFNEKIKNKTIDLIDNIIDGSLSRYGIIAKKIESAIEEKINIVDVDEIGLESVSKIISDILESRIENEYKRMAYEKVAESVKEILGPVKKELTFFEFREKVYDIMMRYNDSSCDFFDSDEEKFRNAEEEYYTLIIDHSDEHDWVTLYIDEEPDTSKSMCDYSITVHKDFMSFRKNNMKFNGKYFPFESNVGIDSLIYQLYLNDSQIIYDTVDVY